MKKKYQLVVGIDEVGRGALAAPVIAAAITGAALSIFNSQFSKGLKDSKKLSPKKREEIFEILKGQPGIKWGIGKVSEKVIDKINILEATKLAMVKAVSNLAKKLKNKKIDFLLIDGNFGIEVDLPQKSIIKGDEKIFLIKLASIVAKVSRDRLMLKYHRKHPQYGFEKHKGYPTKLHRRMLKKFGPCGIHRKTFRPVKQYCKD